MFEIQAAEAMGTHQKAAAVDNTIERRTTAREREKETTQNER